VCFHKRFTNDLLLNFPFVGGGEAPRALSGRLIAATWWLFGFIIIATYTANLAAFLTVSRLETPIKSLDDLSNQYKVKYGPSNGSSALVYFKRMAEIEERFYRSVCKIKTPIPSNNLWSSIGKIEGLHKL